MPHDAPKQKPLRRFRRAEQEQKPGLLIQERDLEILNLIHDYRFLNSDLIKTLISGSEQQILRRLQKMYHHGYLDRLKIGNNEPILYGLGKEGISCLSDYYKLDFSFKENRGVGGIYLAHTLQIANFRACLILALRDNQRSKIISWHKDGEVKEEIGFIENDKKARIPIVPDSFFTLEDKGSLKHFFLEADRSTMSNQRFLTKMRGYFKLWNYIKTETKKQKTFSYKIDGVQIENFRVLTVCKTEQRKENLRIITREADDKKTGSDMFWFIAEGKYNLQNPKTILYQIWQTPKDDTLRSLI